MEKKNLRSKLLEFQLVENRLKVLESRRNLILSKIAEIERTIQCLDDVQKSGKSEILLSIGSNVYVPGSLKKSEKILVELGAGVAVEKSVEGARSFLEKKLKILENGIASIENEMVNLSQRLNELGREIRKKVEKVE
ncbi:MAG TPA: prefoldin subunit alpha [Candidatus Aenigmarchaeota archaeon]|nr:prefoldin subunit alpha [Candidatus Aenigmarchaeota archaeon]